MKYIKIPNRAYYFSIDIHENRPHYSVMVPGMKSVTRIKEGYGDRYLFEVLGDGADSFRFECELCGLLERAEANRPDRVFLSITFYNECFEVVADYEGVSDNEYYCCNLDADMRKVVKEFIGCVASGKQMENIGE